MLGKRHAELLVGEHNAARAFPTRTQFARGALGDTGQGRPFQKRQHHIAVITEQRNGTLAGCNLNGLIGHDACSLAGKCAMFEAATSTRSAALRILSAHALSTRRCSCGYFVWV